MLLHCKVFNVLYTVISILFFTSPYNLFVFQSTITNWRLVFILFYYFLSTLYYFVLVFFFFFNTISLSLSLPIDNLSFSKIWWWFYVIKYALLVYLFKFCVSNLISFVFHSSFDALGVRMSIFLALLHLMWTILFI